MQSTHDLPPNPLKPDTPRPENRCRWVTKYLLNVRDLQGTEQTLMSAQTGSLFCGSLPPLPIRHTRNPRPSRGGHLPSATQKVSGGGRTRTRLLTLCPRPHRLPQPLRAGFSGRGGAPCWDLGSFLPLSAHLEGPLEGPLSPQECFSQGVRVWAPPARIDGDP